MQEPIVYALVEGMDEMYKFSSLQIVFPLHGCKLESDISIWMSYKNEEYLIDVDGDP